METRTAASFPSRWRSLITLMLAVAALVPASPARADPSHGGGDATPFTGGWIFPVGPPGGPPPVARGFDPPDQPWLPGHRGVDLSAAEGDAVSAASGGVVVHAGLVAGVGVVSISHGEVRTTYQPVRPSVRAGDHVATGTPIGTLEVDGGHCPPSACLHWGALEGTTYIDPLALVGGPAIRLLPLQDRAITEDPPPPSAAGLAWPVVPPFVTSPFGSRVHPVTGIRKLHDGTDFRAPCGAPVRASAPGMVTSAGRRGAYGLQIAIDHGVISGAHTTTSSSHLSRMDVTVGARVATGQVIGRSGTTGLSTGCHLHFMVHSDGALVDPMSRLPGTRPAASPPRTPPVKRAGGPVGTPW